LTVEGARKLRFGEEIAIYIHFNRKKADPDSEQWKRSNG